MSEDDLEFEMKRVADNTKSLRYIGAKVLYEKIQINVFQWEAG